MFRITIPLVRPNLTISTILNIIYVFNSFPIIWTITKGDPANRTDTLVTYLYKLAFYNGKHLLLYHARAKMANHNVVFIIPARSPCTATPARPKDRPARR